MGKEKRMVMGLINPGETLADRVKYMQSLKNDKINYYSDFLGHYLYSDTVTLDSAYMEVYGVGVSEYQSLLKEAFNKYNSEADGKEYDKQDILPFREAPLTYQEKLKIFDKEKTAKETYRYLESKHNKSK